MEKQFVTPEIASKLMVLGFDEDCMARFEEGKLNIIMSNDIGKRKFLQAPLWQQVMDWFREKHNIDIELPYGGNKCNYYVFVKDDYIYDGKDPKQFITYYEAREQAILKAIELCQRHYL